MPFATPLFDLMCIGVIFLLAIWILFTPKFSRWNAKVMDLLARLTSSRLKPGDWVQTTEDLADPMLSPVNVAKGSFGRVLKFEECYPFPLQPGTSVEYLKRVKEEVEAGKSCLIRIERALPNKDNEMPYQEPFHLIDRRNLRKL